MDLSLLTSLQKIRFINAKDSILNYISFSTIGGFVQYRISAQS